MEQLTRREKEKKIREEEIITAAEKIFFEKGFHDTSMDEIAKASQFTKKTLYQYFLNKEDLYFAVAAREFKVVISYFEEGIKEGTTGLDKIKSMCNAYYAYYKDFPQSFSLMNYCQFIQTPRENISHYKEILEHRKTIFQYFFNIIEEGKADKSLRKDLDTKETMISLFMLITGFFSRFAELRKAPNLLAANDHDRFVSFTIDLIVNSIKADK